MTADDGARARVEFLRHVPLLRHARPQDLENIAAIAESRDYAAGDVIFWQGSEGRELFIVESGEVAITQNLAGQVDSVVARFGPRAFFGELRLILGGPRSATAQATEPTRVITVPGDAVLQLVEDHPETGSRLLLALAEELAQRLMETNARLRDAIVWGLQATGFLEEYAEGENGREAPGSR